MDLDVIIPTFNRRDMLRRTLASLAAAEIPDGLSVGVTVVDNGGTDRTDELVAGFRGRLSTELQYVVEKRPGKSHALNAGIATTAAELVGMIDDDEEVEPRWFARVRATFAEHDIDFAGGPYRPVWGATPPAWLPANYLGVLGWVDGGDRMVPFDRSYPGVLMGGNAVIRRDVLERAGPYWSALGPTPEYRLMSCEDEDMYERLLEIGARGLYVPDLIVYHHVPAERLTRSYYRRWCFWRGVSRAVLARHRRAPVRCVAGVPRYLYGNAIRAMARMAGACVSRRATRTQIFADELPMWDLAGFLYGRHLYRGRSGEAAPAPAVRADSRPMQARQPGRGASLPETTRHR